MAPLRFGKLNRTFDKHLTVEELGGITDEEQFKKSPLWSQVKGFQARLWSFLESGLGPMAFLSGVCDNIFWRVLLQNVLWDSRKVLTLRPAQTKANVMTHPYLYLLQQLYRTRPRSIPNQTGL